MIVAATLAGPLPRLGVVVLALLTAAALLLSSARPRGVAVLGSLVLAPILLLAAVWSSPQLATAHRHPLLAVVAGCVALAGVGGLARILTRRRGLLAVIAVAALPFRVPISVGGSTFNLLVPLYVTVLAGALAALVGLRHGAGEDAENGRTSGLRRPAQAPLEWGLAVFVVLYALQSSYSDDFQKALQQLVFFYVPFSLLFMLLRDLRWSRALVVRCLQVVVALALAFSLIGFYEYATRTLLLNPKLIAANEVHTYFTVNSVFFDPDIFGRFLALVMICLAAVLLHDRRRRSQSIAIAVLAVLWGCLVLTLSRSSLAALLLGLAVLAALRWRTAPILAAGAALLVAGALAVVIAPKTFGLNQGLNGASSGRAGLVSGGVRLFEGRPLWGWGSASFVNQYRRHHPGTAPALAASHTIAVTIAAEQGVIGLAVYVAQVAAALVMLLRRARGDPARVALAACFIALVFHTLLYADFLEDPVSWALLGIGAALARRGTVPSAAGLPAPAVV